MPKTHEQKARGPGGTLISRREMLAGAAAAAIVASTPSVLATSLRKKSPAATQVTRKTMPLVRHLAAAAALGDGRILVTGGYDRPWSEGDSPTALSSTGILDPRTGRWYEAPPMSMPRARHAAVTLADGRVAVIGGIAQNPTASVEIFDPMTNTWSMSKPLEQPRFDHNAVADGNSVYILGGSSQGVRSGVEVLQL